MTGWQGIGVEGGMRRSLVASLVIHALLVLVATVVARPHFRVPKPLTAIPIDFVAMAAPAPALVERQQQPKPSVRRDAVPDPLKPKPKPKPPEKEPPKKEPVKNPVEKPKPQRDLPKVGSADTTKVLQSELPRVGDLKGAMQMRVDGPALPYAYYLAMVQRKLATYWEPPGGLAQAGVETSAVVWFRIERDGSVRTNYVEEPSGMNLFDTAALRALERALPMPPLPVEYPGESLIIHVRFVYSE
jgi:periplasmic protein TonB